MNPQSTEVFREINADLLAALEALLHLHETPGDFSPSEESDVMEEAHAAIAKARGDV